MMIALIFFHPPAWSKLKIGKNIFLPIVIYVYHWKNERLLFCEDCSFLLVSTLLSYFGFTSLDFVLPDLEIKNWGVTAFVYRFKNLDKNRVLNLKGRKVEVSPVKVVKQCKIFRSVRRVIAKMYCQCGENFQLKKRISGGKR